MQMARADCSWKLCQDCRRPRWPFYVCRPCWEKACPELQEAYKTLPAVLADGWQFCLEFGCWETTAVLGSQASYCPHCEGFREHTARLEARRKSPQSVIENLVKLNSEHIADVVAAGIDELERRAKS